MKTATLVAMGFDQAEYNRSAKCWRVRCSQCEVLVINGHPTHETGCPNERRARERRRT